MGTGHNKPLSRDRGGFGAHCLLYSYDFCFQQEPGPNNSGDTGASEPLRGTAGPQSTLPTMSEQSSGVTIHSFIPDLDRRGGPGELQ